LPSFLQEGHFMTRFSLLARRVDVTDPFVSSDGHRPAGTVTIGRFSRGTGSGQTLLALFLDAG
jgi:hypothetical protein